MPKAGQKPITDPSRTQFGRNIAELRKIAGLTQERLAEACGIAPRYLQSLEAGEYFPSLQNLLALRRALKSTWEDLFQGCDEAK